MDAVDGVDAAVEEVDVEVAMEFVSEDEDEETYQPTGVGIHTCTVYCSCSSDMLPDTYSWHDKVTVPPTIRYYPYFYGF